MPLPMVHFCVAQGLLDCFLDKEIFISNKSDFFLGVISPDAVHVRKDFEKANKVDSHLRDSEIDIWLENAVSFTKKQMDPNNSYLFGYGVHILTDIFWTKSEYQKHKERYAADSNPIQEMKMAYYNDTDQLDFELYKNYSRRQEIWKLLEKGKANESDGFDKFVSAVEADRWKTRTLTWYDSGKSEHSNPIKYLKIEDIEEFIPWCVEEIILILHK